MWVACQKNGGATHRRDVRANRAAEEHELPARLEERLQADKHAALEANGPHRADIERFVKVRARQEGLVP